MAEINGNVWRIYPGDAPGFVGRDIPGGSLIFAHRIVWTPDASSLAGDAVHIKDSKGRTVFFHEAASGETEFVKEYASPINGKLEIAALESGVVEVFIE